MTHPPQTLPLQRYRVTNTTSDEPHLIHPVHNTILCNGHTPENHKLGPTVKHEDLPSPTKTRTNQLCAQCLLIATQTSTEQVLPESTDTSEKLIG